MAAAKTSMAKPKKVNKNETQGNILIFYAVQHVASTVFKTKVSGSKIAFKSPTKAQVQYELMSASGVTNDHKRQIAEQVNQLLSSDTKVSSTKCERSDANKVVDGIDSDSTLYSVQLNGQVMGLSHLAITLTDLATLSDFKMIKCNYKQNKNVLDVFYSFKSTESAASAHGQSKRKAKQDANNRSYFEDTKEDESDERLTFSKEVIDIVLKEMKVDNMDNEKLGLMLSKVHDVMNQFQNISYTKGYKAACLK